MRRSAEMVKRLGVVLLALLLVGCSTRNEKTSNPSGDIQVPLSALRLSPSADCDDLKGYLEASWVEQFTSAQLYPSIRIGAEPVEGGGSPADASTAPPDDISQTNIQEPGVDEADRVKADRDGNLYVLTGNFLVIEQGFPPDDLKELGRLDLNAAPQVLYLDESSHRVVVIAFAQVSVLEAAPSAEPVAFSGTELIFVDVSDPAQPLITGRLYLEGYAIGSRRVGSRVHLVSQFWIELPPILRDDPAFWDLVAQYSAAIYEGRTEEADALKQEIRNTIHTAITLIDIEELLPHAVSRVDGADTDLALLSCTDISRPEVVMQPGLLTVTSLDMDGSDASAVGIMNNAWLMYATQEHLYVSQTSGGWWWSPEQAEQTAIYKFEISEAKPVYLATGSIDGWVKDQFSFSEYEGFLRVATTEDRFDGEINQWRSKNHLFVLEDTHEGTLIVTGAVRDVAPDERIFAMRFLEDRGFMVTFRMVDPLFAFDLSDPAHPVLVGELEIPGFSTYIHSIDHDHLLTVGSDGANLQLQTFDVTDLSTPTLLHQYTVPGTFSYSEAQYDHLAFNYYAPRELLVIPLVTVDESGGTYFSGMAAYRVSLTDGFTELGRVDHADLAHQAYCSDIPPEETWRAESCEQGWYLWGAAPRRSVIMTSGEATYLYSISDIGVKATPVDAPGTVLGSVLFPISEILWWPLGSSVQG